MEALRVIIERLIDLYLASHKPSTQQDDKPYWAEQSIKKHQQRYNGMSPLPAAAGQIEHDLVEGTAVDLPSGHVKLRLSDGTCYPWVLIMRVLRNGLAGQIRIQGRRLDPERSDMINLQLSEIMQVTCLMTGREWQGRDLQRIFMALWMVEHAYLRPAFPALAVQEAETPSDPHQDVMDLPFETLSSFDGSPLQLAHHLHAFERLRGDYQRLEQAMHQAEIVFAEDNNITAAEAAALEMLERMILDSGSADSLQERADKLGAVRYYERSMKPAYTDLRRIEYYAWARKRYGYRYGGGYTFDYRNHRWRRRRHRGRSIPLPRELRRKPSWIAGAERLKNSTDGPQMGSYFSFADLPWSGFGSPVLLDRQISLGLTDGTWIQSALVLSFREDANARLIMSIRNLDDDGNRSQTVRLDCVEELICLRSGRRYTGQASCGLALLMLQIVHLQQVETDALIPPVCSAVYGTDEDVEPVDSAEQTAPPDETEATPDHQPVQGDAVPDQPQDKSGASADDTRIQATRPRLPGKLIELLLAIALLDEEFCDAELDLISELTGEGAEILSVQARQMQVDGQQAGRRVQKLLHPLLNNRPRLIWFRWQMRRIAEADGVISPKEARVMSFLDQQVERLKNQTE
ncbi:MAG: hypothetical protein Alpg2KO_11240 [Alphaproteobacteria bacterium]